MTLDEAIKHCLEVAENNEQFASGKWIGSEGEAHRQDCLQCAADHRQLAEWLTELKEVKRLLKSATGIIKDVDCNEDYLCDECEYHAKCDGGFNFYWRYANEALKLIGGNENER